MNPRCLTVFEQSCKSKRTLRDYKMNLDYFLKFSHKDYDSLLLLPQIELDEYNRKIIQRKYAPSYFAKAVDKEEERIVFNNLSHEEMMRKYVRGYPG